MAPRRKRVRSLGTFDVSVPPLPLVPLAPADKRRQPPTIHMVTLSIQLDIHQATHLNTPPVCPSDPPELPHKRRRLEGFYQMPSLDEPSSSAVGYQEKLPVAGPHDHQQSHDATSIIPRWAPAMPDVQSLSSPLTCMAESMLACCNFAWQHPTGYQPLPSPATVVYEPPQPYTMEVVPPAPAQAIHSMQHLVPGTEGLPQHTPAQVDQLNLDALPLGSYPVLGETSLQTLLQPAFQPILQEPPPLENAGNDPYLVNQTGQDYPNQLASSELYNYPIVTAAIPMSMPLIDENPMDANTSPLLYDPAPPSTASPTSVGDH
ncbi:hypothetical protein TrVGV298_008900 [Trichoderma virens]|nr:hypothetical protein TrVGV298_008900 [Trichoderma virens]